MDSREFCFMNMMLQMDGTKTSLLNSVSFLFISKVTMADLDSQHETVDLNSSIGRYIDNIKQFIRFPRDGEGRYIYLFICYGGKKERKKRKNKRVLE